MNTKKYFPDCFVYQKNDSNLYYIALVATDKQGEQLKDENNRPYFSKKAESTNKNELANIISDYQNCKLIKKCEKLSIEKSLSTFYPHCSTCSLYWENRPIKNGFTGSIDGQFLLGCDDDCKFYIPRWKGLFIKYSNKIWRKLKIAIRSVFQWLNKQPIIIQIIIYLMFFITVNPHIFYLAISAFERLT